MCIKTTIRKPIKKIHNEFQREPRSKQSPMIKLIPALPVRTPAECPGYASRRSPCRPAGTSEFNTLQNRAHCSILLLIFCIRKLQQG